MSFQHTICVFILFATAIATNDVAPTRGMLRSLESMTEAPKPKISTCPDYNTKLESSSCENYSVKECRYQYLVRVNETNGKWKDLQCTPELSFICGTGGQWIKEKLPPLIPISQKPCDPDNFDKKDYKHYFKHAFNRCARKSQNQNYRKTFKYVSFKYDTAGTEEEGTCEGITDECKESVIALDGGNDDVNGQEIKVSMLCPKTCGVCV